MEPDPGTMTPAAGPPGGSDSDAAAARSLTLQAAAALAEGRRDAARALADVAGIYACRAGAQELETQELETQARKDRAERDTEGGAG